MGSARATLKFRRLAVVLLTASGAALGGLLASEKVWGQRAGPPPKPTDGAATPIMGREALAKEFEGHTKPFLEEYCIQCHAGADAPGGLDLEVENLDQMGTRSEKLLKMMAKVSNG